jgi:hypothetical protein
MTNNNDESLPKSAPAKTTKPASNDKKAKAKKPVVKNEKNKKAETVAERVDREQREALMKAGMRPDRFIWDVSDVNIMPSKVEGPSFLEKWEKAHGRKYNEDEDKDKNE